MTQVRLDVTDGVAVVTLDGPARLNAFSSTTGRELSAAYRTCDADDEVKVVVLTGAGRAFCAGADLSPSADSFGAPGDDFSASPVDPPAFGVRKLVVAAVNGSAIGIGLTLALQCDLRIVAADATLAIPQVRFGMIGDGHSHLTLPRIAGRGVAAEMLLTGRSITGAEAFERGIANRAVPADQVLEQALELAHDVAVNASPASIALSKHILWADLDAPDVERRETAAHRVLMAHPDAQEGAAAWREKRSPRWGFAVSDLPGEPDL
ncbi:enoyl-CoA hydratase/carnithine racemase [Marmoricola sp. OAE513]|uniref:enoyl-CoA hydratase/isomerase family protein n=1 Tax=Marmoricola sp. OAE513 TaxID=2817894 RepID=UPI001AE64D8A